MKQLLIFITFVLVVVFSWTSQTRAWVIIAPTNPTTPAAQAPVRIAPPRAEPRVPKISNPTILSPQANQIFSHYPRTITVYWQADGSRDHTIEISCDYCSSRFAWASSPWIYVVGSGESFTTTLPGDNTYRVRVKNSRGWSSFIYFSFKT